MNNYNFLDGEELYLDIDNILVKNNNVSRLVTVVLTNKRIMLMDYINLVDGMEVLRIAKGMDYLRTRDVIYEIGINNISLEEREDSYYLLKDKRVEFSFYNQELYDNIRKFYIEN